MPEREYIQIDTLRGLVGFLHLLETDPSPWDYFYIEYAGHRFKVSLEIADAGG